MHMFAKMRIEARRGGGDNKNCYTIYIIYNRFCLLRPVEMFRMRTHFILTIFTIGFPGGQVQVEEFLCWGIISFPILFFKIYTRLGDNFPFFLVLPPASLSPSGRCSRGASGGLTFFKRSNQHAGGRSFDIYRSGGGGRREGAVDFLLPACR